MSSNTEAIIYVTGILGTSHYADTLYSELKECIEVYTKEGKEKIILDFDSPGGTVNGIDTALNAIRACPIPIESYISGQCCSAAYYLASQTSKITAAGPNVTVGSIGVWSAYYCDKKYLENLGVEEVVVVSSGSPDKYPMNSEHFKKLEQPLVDKIMANFAHAVAAGRGIMPEDVLKNYGGGRVFLAEDALAVGMIDAIDNVENKKTEEKQGEKNMDEDQIVSILLSDPEAAIEVIKKTCDQNENIAMAVKSHLDLVLKAEEEKPAEAAGSSSPSAAKTNTRIEIKTKAPVMKDAGFGGTISIQNIDNRHPYLIQREKIMAAKTAAQRRAV